MKTSCLITTGTFVSVITLSFCFLNVYAQENLQQQTTETKQTSIETPRKTSKPAPRRNFVKMADFYLKNGKLVFGKLLSEDRNKITVERLNEARIIVSTYSKMEVDSRTLNTKRIPEYKYYLDLAEYFSGRTWDFTDDPDDFIQAIRCYEKAKQSMAETQGPQSEKIEQINKKIGRLEADRQLWIKQTQSRADLKKLEFEAEFETRLKEFEGKINANNQRIDTVLSDIQASHQQLQDATKAMNNDVSHQLDMISERINYNRRFIDRIIYFWHRFPPHGWLPPEHFGGNR